MRIAIVSPEFPPDIGGIETYAWEFTRELATRGHQVTVFTRRHVEREADLPGVNIRPVLRLRRSLDSAALVARKRRTRAHWRGGLSWWEGVRSGLGFQAQSAVSVWAAREDCSAPTLSVPDQFAHKAKGAYFGDQSY